MAGGQAERGVRVAVGHGDRGGARRGDAKTGVAAAGAGERGDDGAHDATTGDASRRGLDFSQMVRHVTFALVVGVVGAVASMALSLSVDFAAALSARFPWLLLVLPLCGVASVLLYRALGLPAHLATDVMVDDLRANRRVPTLVAPGILLGTCLTVLGGGSVGKEAAALQMGAALGVLVGRPFRLRAIRRERGGEALPGYAAACGMAAAFSALFFAPLGSTMFVLELTRFKGSVARHAPTMLLAAFSAYALAHAVGIGDVIAGPAVPEPSWEIVAQCLIVGLCCAVAGTVFAVALRGLRRLVRTRWGASWKGNARAKRTLRKDGGPAAGGDAVSGDAVGKGDAAGSGAGVAGVDGTSRDGSLGVAAPAAATVAGGLLAAGLVLACGWRAFEGTGMALLQGALGGVAHPLDFAVKMLLTVLVLGFGFKGGEIMPMFAIGALLGCALGQLTGVSPAFSAALGLVAFFAAASRCPLAALLMGAELFGWAALPYAALAVGAAYVGSHDVGVFGRGVLARAAVHAARLRRRFGARWRKAR